MHTGSACTSPAPAITDEVRRYWVGTVVPPQDFTTGDPLTATVLEVFCSKGLLAELDA